MLSTLPGMAGQALAAIPPIQAFQEENDVAAWSGALWELGEGPVAELDAALVGADHQLSLIERFFPQVAADPEFGTLKAQVLASEGTARFTTGMLLALLTPHRVRGASVAGLTPPPTEPLASPSSALAAVEARFTLMIQAAFDAEVLADTPLEPGGYGLESRAIELCAGPLGHFPVLGPEWNYVWESLRARKPPPALLARLHQLLGLGDGNVYTARTELGGSGAAWADGRPGATAPAQRPGTGGAAGPAGPRQAGRPSSGGPHAAPKIGTQGLDSTKVTHPKARDWGEEEEAPKKTTPPKTAATNEPATWRTKGKASSDAGKVGGGVDVTRTRNPDTSGSDTTVSVEGGANADRAYGTVGASTRIRSRDAATDHKSGMDTDVGGKVGTNDKGQVVAQGNVGIGVKRADGSEINWGKTVGTDGNGLQVGQNVGHTTTGANGDKRTRSGNAGYNTGTDELSVGGGVTTKDAKGEVRSSTTANAKVDLNSADGTQGASGTVGHQAGKVNVVATASWKQELKAPVQEGARWRVDYSESKAAGGSLGAKGKKAGGSAGITYTSAVAGTRYFKSKPEAERFWRDGDVPADLRSAADARKMNEGDSRTESSGTRADLAGNAQVGMFSVGGGVNFGSENFEKTRRGARGSLRVEVGAHVFDGWNASAGAGGVSLGYGESHTDSKSHTVEFDLDSEVGAWAYDYYQQKGKLPPSGRGWREVGTMKGTSDTRAKNLGLLGVAVGNSHTVSHEERMEDGDRIVDDSGVEGSSVSVPLLGSHNEKHGLYMQRINQGPAFYQSETEVTSSDVDDIKRSINRGTDQAMGTSGTNKGTYKIQSVFSEREVDGFLEQVEKGGKGGTLHSNMGWLRSRIGAEKDPDARRRLLARWVADNGDDALQAMFDLTKGDANSNFYVEIKGDEFMTGMKGHLDQERRIAQLQARIDQGEGGFAIANEVRTDLHYQRRRRDALRLYGELPQSLLDKEYSRTDQHLLNLQTLEDRALSTITEMAPDSQVGGETSQVLKSNQVLRRARRQYAESHRQVQRSRRIHLDGLGRGLGLDDSAYEEWTSEREHYKKAEALFSQGQTRETAAHVWESALGAQKLGADNAGLLAGHTVRAAGEFQAAARLFDQSSAVYVDIADRRGPNQSLTSGYQYRYTDGM